MENNFCQYVEISKSKTPKLITYNKKIAGDSLKIMKTANDPHITASKTRYWFTKGFEKQTQKHAPFINTFSF